MTAQAVVILFSSYLQACLYCQLVQVCSLRLCQEESVLLSFLVGSTCNVCDKKFL